MYISSPSANDSTICRATIGTKRPTIHIPPLENPIESASGQELTENAQALVQHLVATLTPQADEIDEEIVSYLNGPFQVSLSIKSFTIN